MNETNLPASAPWTETNATVMARFYHLFSSHQSSTGTRLLLILVLVVLLHLTVRIVRGISEWLINKSHAQKSPFDFVTQQPKFITLIQLVSSAVTFVMYFFAVGLMLEEFGVNLTAYLASASIIALAISFGSQGLVQDIVSSLTLIFCDTMDVGDLVEIAGTTNVSGRVEQIGLRFTKLANFNHQQVLIPNRTIANVSRFPIGGVDAYGDVHLPERLEPNQAARVIGEIARGMQAQFGAIIFSEPTVEEVRLGAGASGHFFRVHFKIWPGQSSLIETTFRQRAISAMRAFDANYADWQVPVTYRATPLPQQFLNSSKDRASAPQRD